MIFVPPFMKQTDKMTAELCVRRNFDWTSIKLVQLKSPNDQIYNRPPNSGTVIARFLHQSNYWTMIALQINSNRFLKMKWQIELWKKRHCPAHKPWAHHVHISQLHEANKNIIWRILYSSASSKTFQKFLTSPKCLSVQCIIWQRQKNLYSRYLKQEP